MEAVRKYFAKRQSALSLIVVLKSAQLPTQTDVLDGAEPPSPEHGLDAFDFDHTSPFDQTIPNQHWIELKLKDGLALGVLSRRNGVSCYVGLSQPFRSIHSSLHNY